MEELRIENPKNSNTIKKAKKTWEVYFEWFIEFKEHSFQHFLVAIDRWADGDATDAGRWDLVDGNSIGVIVGLTLAQRSFNYIGAFLWRRLNVGRPFSNGHNGLTLTLVSVFIIRKRFLMVGMSGGTSPSQQLILNRRWPDHHPTLFMRQEPNAIFWTWWTLNLNHFLICT